MKITADTNVLLRAIVDDDRAQATRAIKLLEAADIVAVSLQVLCELVWVLRGRYGVSRADIAASIRALMDTGNVAVNRPAVEAGLALLEEGGDFADGIIAFDGAWLGGKVFASFDKQAVSVLRKQGRAVHLL